MIMYAASLMFGHTLWGSEISPLWVSLSFSGLGPLALVAIVADSVGFYLCCADSLFWCAAGIVHVLLLLLDGCRNPGIIPCPVLAPATCLVGGLSLETSRGWVKDAPMAVLVRGFLAEQLDNKDFRAYACGDLPARTMVAALARSARKALAPALLRAFFVPSTAVPFSLFILCAAAHSRRLLLCGEAGQTRARVGREILARTAPS
jgi:hypothetical protein